MKNKSKNKLFTAEIMRQAVYATIDKMKFSHTIKNPVIFTVVIGALVMMVFTALSAIRYSNEESFMFNWWIMVLLLITAWFSVFAEAVAEARGKAQAASLKATREFTRARKLDNNGDVIGVNSSMLQKGDVFIVEAGEIIPYDGEIIKGIASVDESAITGESAPVIREAGTDHSGVIGGTKVLSDSIVVQVTAAPGDTFLDKMIALVEGANRQKTPNEIALTILLVSFTIVFLVVVTTLKPFSMFVNAFVSVPALISLFVCLIPTTIGGLLSAIGIAGMDRALQANVIAKSGKAVESAGDVDVVLLDKTGTITIGNRKATKIIPINGFKESELFAYSYICSLADPTPEGKSIVELSLQLSGHAIVATNKVERTIAFSAESRMSGVDFTDGSQIRKGAASAIQKWALSDDSAVAQQVGRIVNEIAQNGGTPLVIAKDKRTIGVVQLEDIIKPGIKERFARMRKMGVKTVMVTGDNPLTAKYIAAAAGVDDFIAEAKPEDKMHYILEEQKLGKLVAMMGDGTNDAPALAQADVGVAMNSGTQAAKEAANMVDLDSDPTKLLEVIEIGKQLLITRGNITTFSIVNDIAKYFAIVPAMFVASIPGLAVLDIMHLHSPQSAIMSALIFNALIIPGLIPLALKGVKYRPIGAEALLMRNLLIYGLGGLLTPFIGIKLIDICLTFIM